MNFFSHIKKNIDSFTKHTMSAMSTSRDDPHPEYQDITDDMLNMYVVRIIDFMEMAMGDKYKSVGFIFTPHAHLMHGDLHYIHATHRYFSLMDELGKDHPHIEKLRVMSDTLHSILVSEINDAHPEGFPASPLDVFHRTSYNSPWVVNGHQQKVFLPALRNII